MTFDSEPPEYEPNFVGGLTPTDPERRQRLTAFLRNMVEAETSPARLAAATARRDHDPLRILAWARWAQEAGWTERQLAAVEKRPPLPAPNVDANRRAWETVCEVFRMKVTAAGTLDTYALHLGIGAPADSANREVVAMHHAVLGFIRGREREIADALLAALRADAECTTVAYELLAEHDDVTVKHAGSRPRIEDLTSSAGISNDTFRRVRCAAGIRVTQRGGAARARPYSAREVDALRNAASAGAYHERSRMVAAWGKWGSDRAGEAAVKGAMKPQGGNEAAKHK